MAKGVTKAMSRILTFGETMLRFSPANIGDRIIQTRDFIIEPGGSESNVAIALAALGHHTLHYTRLPKGSLGDLIIQHLRGKGVDTSLIQRGGDRIGCYWTDWGLGSRPAEVIYDREYSAFATWPETDIFWKKSLSGINWVHISGITPGINPHTAKLLSDGINSIGDAISISLDLNYRHQLWRYMEEGNKATKINDVICLLCSHCRVIFGNETDYQHMLCLETVSTDNPIDSYFPIAEKLFCEFSVLQCVAISLRISHSASENTWSGLIYNRGVNGIEAYQGITYELKNIVDRLGAGDSYAAGIIHGLVSSQKDFQDIVDFAVTLSALKHTVRGDACTFCEKEVRQVLAAKASGRVIQ